MRKVKYTTRLAETADLALPIKSFYLMEGVAAGRVPVKLRPGESQHPGKTESLVRDTCSMFMALILASMRAEQAGCSEIRSFEDLVDGCAVCLTDREKSNTPNKIRARPF